MTQIFWIVYFLRGREQYENKKKRNYINLYWPYCRNSNDAQNAYSKQ